MLEPGFPACGRCYALKRRKIEMMIVLAALELVLLCAVVALLLRRRAPAEDSRTAGLVAELPAQFARLDARLAAVDEHLRSSIAQLRAETSTEAQSGREAAER